MEDIFTSIKMLQRSIKVVAEQALAFPRLRAKG